ncbi:LAMA2 protein, partial [Scopus umbretta]|nr:LAMA2 protein [Scopus umbretta]
SPMDFAQPVSFENADIGRCPSLEPEVRPPEDEDTPIHTTDSLATEMKSASITSAFDSMTDSCAADTEPAILEGGKQFGLSRNSHIAVAFDDTKVKNRYIVCF